MTDDRDQRQRRMATWHPPIRGRSIQERFWSKVAVTANPTKCWVWQGARNYGYGIFWDGTLTSKGNKRAVKAHRFAYESVKGPIPEGKQLDHLCRNRPCVNPDHLEPVTNWENAKRGNNIMALKSKQTHCIRGHPLSGDNLDTRQGRRRCKICQREKRKLG